jgi:hypothetical protein
MSRRRTFVEIELTLFAFALLAFGSRSGELRAQSPTVSAPVLTWQYGGCISGPYCQTGWYSSPAVADLDGDGQPDVSSGGQQATTGSGPASPWRT